ncbi:hypothetical protein [Pedobacter cryoconitis]|uniref:Phytanoyl-CoA dioxygenase PhyH n=1 Tax=Pedobacter cryoconitis TaxID=188932 RepID=A0A327SYG0_9SPHI|nr:hypothetical protein [Pedobacter cryoconitis]RAJ33472.1 hypothetical protein LY11_01521 [Pedobacter cryoconitis]
MIKEIKYRINYLRAHLVVLRKFKMLFNINGRSFVKPEPALLESTGVINREGFCAGPSISSSVLEEIKAIYESRIVGVIPKPTGAPFTNLILDEDITIDNPVIKLAFSKDILDPAMDYFGGKLLFESLQVLYSYPTDGKLRESQYWHKDFGDSKSFHAIMYLNDVEKLSQGPFVFVSKKDSEKMKRSVIIRRINDEIFSKELGTGKIEYFYGKAGESVFVDPAICYHYGSRCKVGRLALFFTFNTSTPYIIMPGLIQKNSAKFLEIGKKLRPDIPVKKLSDLLGINR